MSLARPQGDLFSLDSPLLTEVRGEQSLMAFPFFALSKSKWTKPLAYRNESVSIEIVATSKGVATIYDKEVLLYIASLMVAKLEAGVDVSQEFYFTAHDLFRITGISGSAPLAIRSALLPPSLASIRRRYRGCTEGKTEWPKWEGKRPVRYWKDRWR